MPVPLLLAKLLTVKGLVLAASGATVLTGTAAAATGTIPLPLRKAVDVISGTSTRWGGGADTSSVDENVADETTTTVAETTTTMGVTTTTVAEDLEDDVVSPQHPADDPAGSANDHGEAVSAVAHDETLTGREKGEAVSEVARDNHGQASSRSEVGDGSESGEAGVDVPAAHDPSSPPGLGVGRRELR